MTTPDPKPDFLIVDDDPVFTQVLSKAIRRRGFNTMVAHNTGQNMPVNYCNSYAR